MNPNRAGIFVSLMLHGGAVALVYALSSSIAQPIKPMAIDFTLLEPAGRPSPEPPAAKRQARPEPTAPGKKAPAPVMERSRPVARKPAQTPLPGEPATQPQGAVPVPASPNQALPGPVRHAAPQPAEGSGAGGGGDGSPSGSAQGTGGGSGVTSEQLRNRYRAEHFAYIKKIIEQNLAYPPRAQRMGWSGTCVVEFVVQANGHAKDLRVIKSTGYEVLDDNVLETIKKVDPFPRPPIPVKLTIPFTYKLG